MKDTLRPIGRALKYGFLKRQAERRVAPLNGQSPALESAPRAAFLIGCGRSGTTVVGAVLGSHPDVKYFFEPYHLWATIDPVIDVLNLYYEGPARFLLDEDHFTVEAKRRFEKLILEPGKRSHAPLVIEKTPFNACRIGYLEQLSPGAKYVHLIRDGLDVARSIHRLAADKNYRIVGKPTLNRWWGCGGCKWTALAEDGIAKGYFADEIHLLKNYEAKGAYEWIVSLKEIDRWRARLGDRILEMTYDQLTSDPGTSMEQICRFLSLPIRTKWMEQTLLIIEPTRRNPGKPVMLPPGMCEEFNRLQKRFGFLGRAVPGVPEETKVEMAIISNEPTPYRVHVLNRLSRELKGVNVHNVFTHTISNPSMPWEMQIGAHVNPVFFPRHHLTANRPVSPRSIPLFLDITRYIESRDVKMIVLLGYNDLTRMLLVRWARRRRIRLVLAGDSNIFAEGRLPAFIRPVKRPYVRWVLRRLDGLMPMGTCGRAFFRLYLDHNLPEFLFPYEPDYSSLAAPDCPVLDEFRDKHQLDPHRKRMLYCGRLIGVKRVDILMKAFARIAVQRPDWDLVIAGDGPKRTELESLIPPVLKSRVKWLGFLQFQQIVLTYHSCHVLVHPSEFEPWGLVINEAVASHLPVIATSVVGAAVELVHHGKNGMLVSPRSIEAMADAILHVTEGNRYLEMSRQSQEVLESWRHAADPVDGVATALRHFGLIWRQPEQQNRSPSAASSELPAVLLKD